MTPREAIEHRKSVLQPTAVEMAAVNLAAERVRDVWKATPGTHADRYFHPKGVPTADEVIDNLPAGWKRRVKLLDLALMIAADRAGRTLVSTRDPFTVLGDEKARQAIYQKRYYEKKKRRSA